MGSYEWDIKTRDCKVPGEVSRVTQEIIPIEYRDDPAVISFITRYSTVNGRKNDSPTKKNRYRFI